MTTVLIIFSIAFVVCILTTWAAIGIGWKLGIVDRPDGYRKLHAGAIPKLGGPAILIAFAVPIVLLLLFPDYTLLSGVLQERGLRLLGLAVGAVLTLILGVADDVYDLSARRKLIGQILIASVVYFFGFSIGAISNPFGEPIRFGIFTFPITVLWFVACMNAVNLLDGLDGLAAGACLFVGLTIFVVSVQLDNKVSLVLMAALCGSLFGFLLFNFPPARIFLGNSGSLLLGFLMASLSLIGSLSQKAETAVALLMPIVALGLPILDTSMAILRRWYRRMPISTPDKEHIHHILSAMGYSKRRVVLILYGGCVVLGLAALIITLGRSEVVVVMMGALAVVAYVCIRIFSGVRVRDVLAKLAEDTIRRNQLKEAHQAVEQFIVRASGLPDAATLWKEFTAALGILGMDRAELRLTAGHSGSVLEPWDRKNSGAFPDADGEKMETPPAEIWTGRLFLVACGKGIGELVVYKILTTGGLEEQRHRLLGRLRDSLGSELGRVLGKG